MAAPVREEQVNHWQSDQYLSVYHYSEDRMLPLSYQFVEDAVRYHEQEMQRPVPTLILHGTHDDVIPIQASIDFAESRPWVQLVELASDHTLANVSNEIWKAVQEFCAIEKSKPQKHKSRNFHPSTLIPPLHTYALNTGRVKWKQLP